MVTHEPIEFDPLITAADELAHAEGCFYDPEAGSRPIAFIERFCRQSQGRWAGKALALLEWQKDFLRRLFGWKKADGTRRFRRAYLEVAKKNGKSTLLSAIVLYLLVADGEGSPRIFLNACDKEQAAIIFDESAAMVRNSPELSRRLEVVDSRKRIVFGQGQGRIQANSSEAPNKDGANASAIIFDELHRQRDRSLWEMFEYAGVSREQPLTISITTAGEDEQGVWFEQRDYSEKVNSGVIPDTTHLGVIYRAEADDELEEETTWRKANPSLGHTMKLEDFRRDLAEAKESPAKLALFRRLRLNIITKTESRFLTPEAWHECGLDPLDIAHHVGDPCWIGADLSSTTDLTAVSILFGDERAGFDLFARFWLPDGRVEFLSKRDRVPYRSWIAQGYISTTSGDVVDYDAIRAEIVQLSAAHDLRKLAIDPYNATQLGIKLRDEDGIDVEFIRQGFLSLSAPTKELERLVIGRKIRHGGNPVLKWMAGNAIAVVDPAGNLKLDKSKSRQKIDGMASTVNAVAVMSADPTAGESVYESRGILSL